jgi:hypothetical protein
VLKVFKELQAQPERLVRLVLRVFRELQAQLALKEFRE